MPHPPTLVGNGTLLTFGRHPRLLPDGALFLRQAVIADMGRTHALRAAHPEAQFLDAHGRYVMPGRICAHTHTYGAFARAMALKDVPAQDFLQILQRLWWRLDRALRPDDIYYSALVCLVDAIRHGTTTLIDHHSSPNACDGSLDIIAQAFRQAGLRGSLCYEVSDREGKDRSRAAIRENERFIRTVREASPSPQPSPLQGEGGQPAPPLKRSERAETAPSSHRGEGWGEGRSRPARPPLLSAMMGLHAAFTLSDKTIAEAVHTAHDMGVGCHIHVAEGQVDVAHSLDRYGVRTVRRLERLGVLGSQTIAAHCIDIDDDEIRILAETGTQVVHNPRSNMNNAVGTARVAAMLERGILVGLGNDGFSNDMFIEMKAAYLAHKAAEGNPQAMPAGTVQRLATDNNAHIAALAFGGAGPTAHFGELAVGAPADVIVLDYDSPTPVSAHNLPWHLMFGVDGGMVTTTIVAGRVLMHDRVLLALDEQAIFSRARALAAELWERL